MLDIILKVAQDEPSIRVVIMNGSRANKAIKPDIFQDFDIRYLVEDVTKFQDEGWLSVFGEIMIMQEPNRMADCQDSHATRPVFLMQFMDGNRIDLSVVPVAEYHDDGEPAITLFDKDGLLPKESNVSGVAFNLKKPTEKEFQDCCNEFLWLCPYVAKGLWREEIPYGKTMMETYLRKEYLRVTGWEIGLRHGFGIAIGKMGKYIRNYLPEPKWREFLATYPDADPLRIWKALFLMMDSFREKALAVAGQYGFQYPKSEDERVYEFLEDIRKLPKNAKVIR